MSKANDKQQSDWRRDQHTQHKNKMAVKHPVKVDSKIVRNPKS